MVIALAGSSAGGRCLKELVCGLTDNRPRRENGLSNASGCGDGYAAGWHLTIYGLYSYGYAVGMDTTDSWPLEHTSIRAGRHAGGGRTDSLRVRWSEAMRLGWKSGRSERGLGVMRCNIMPRGVMRCNIMARGTIEGTRRGEA